MGFPACFSSQKQYDEWKSLARLTRELVTICTDCTKITATRCLSNADALQTNGQKLHFIHDRREHLKPHYRLLMSELLKEPKTLEQLQKQSALTTSSTSTPTFRR